MKIAFYKATHPGIQGWFNRAIRWFEKGPYSHTELIFSDGMSASSSMLDGGIRFKYIGYDPAKWDIFELPEGLIDEHEARQWYADREEARYDVIGICRFIFKFLPDNPKQYFCSETQACIIALHHPEVLSWMNPNEIAPNKLARLLGFLK
jgi:hypothetical protein